MSPCRTTRTRRDRGFTTWTVRSAGSLLRGPAFARVAAAALLIGLVSISAPGAPRDRDRASREGSRESLHKVSRQLVIPRHARSQRASAARALRAQLQELRSEIDELENDSSGRLAAQLQRRGAKLRAAYSRLRVGHRASSHPARLRDRISELFAEVDRAAAKPAKRGERLDRLRELIDEALAGRPEWRSLRIVVSDGAALTGELAE